MVRLVVVVPALLVCVEIPARIEFVPQGQVVGVLIDREVLLLRALPLGLEFYGLLGVRRDVRRGEPLGQPRMRLEQPVRQCRDLLVERRRYVTRHSVEVLVVGL
jgi:hypothetical protein